MAVRKSLSQFQIFLSNIHKVNNLLVSILRATLKVILRVDF